MSTKPKITEAIKALRDKLANGITISADKDVATVVVTPNMYLDNLPETLTAELIKEVAEYTSDYYAASTLAFGTAANAFCSKNPTVLRAEAEFGLYGKDTWTLGYERTHEITNPQGGSSTAYGYITPKLKTYDARGSKGTLRKVRDQIEAEAMAAFAEK